METRHINWVQHTTQSLKDRLPPLKPGNSAEYLTHRLASLLLERISPEAARALIALLPQESLFPDLRVSAESEALLEIGYTDFLDRAHSALGVFQLNTADNAAKTAADAFLWAIAQDLPPDLKTSLGRELPAELTSRMNLGSAHSEEAKVA
jgi:hypothetical protein